MPTPLAAPHVPPGFLPLAAAGHQTTRQGSPTTFGTKADSQTMSPSSNTALGTETRGLIVSPRGQTSPPGTEVGG
jgi:hypothetical protein